MQIKVSLNGEDLGTFDDEGMTLQEAFAIKASSGLSLQPFFAGLRDMDPLALQTLIWFLRHKKGEQSNAQEIDFRLGDLDMEPVVPPTAPTETEATSVGSETTPSAS